jgi:adenylate cyclase
MWHMGETERAREFAEQAVQSAAELGHAPSSANAYLYVTFLETRRDAPAAALRSAEMVHALGREHGMDFFVALGGILAGWARGRLYDPEAGADELTRALDGYFDRDNRVGTPWFKGLLAELEAVTSGPDAALTLINEGLSISQETEEHFSDPYLYRLRGDILVNRDPAYPVPGEDAYRTAIAIAKDQGARSFHLLAAVALAKLYQSTGRPAEAHAVLAPALQGFSPTPEMPEIAEAQALMESVV